MNKYQITFHSVNGGKFTFSISAKSMSEARTKLLEFSISEMDKEYAKKVRNEDLYLFPSEEDSEKESFILDMRNVFYTEFSMAEKGSYVAPIHTDFELFSFPNFVNLSDKDLKVIIDYIKDDELLAKSLKNTELSVVNKFLANMEREKKLSVTVFDQMVGDVSKDEIEKSQKEVCNIALQLAAEGEITLK